LSDQVPDQRIADHELDQHTTKIIHLDPAKPTEPARAYMQTAAGACWRRWSAAARRLENRRENGTQDRVENWVRDI
jgi:hypothetical protein